MSSRNGFVRGAHQLVSAFVAAIGRMDKSLSPSDTIAKLRAHKFTPGDTKYAVHLFMAIFWLSLLPVRALALLIPVLYGTLILVPFTSQFFWRAHPVLAWVLAFFTSRFIPPAYRPGISVALLPTLETVLYGANISDILTRFTHPLLDVAAWLPYGFIHFIFPFVVALLLWLFRKQQALHTWATAFGYMNLTGVLVQLSFPCAAPWYELIYGLTPADYSVPGDPGGLGRIDALLNTNTYTVAFNNSPVVFGAFPSLHSACATMEALFIAHFFPRARTAVWAYAAVLYWATMYLTHHYLIDVVGGACLAIAFFYLFLPDALQGPAATAPPDPPSRRSGLSSKYDAYDLDAPLRQEDESDGDEEVDITYRSPVPGAGQQFARQQKKHTKTASIASLIRAGDRVEDGWSPIGGSFGFPPTPNPAKDAAAKV